jgi:DNA-directed RNA polymerase II subunit RPB9
MDGQMDDTSSDNKKKIAFMFCKKWYAALPRSDEANQASSNMLYPLEEANSLLFKCRNCKWETPATSNCVYRNDLSTAVGETSGVTQDIGQDPTVGAHPSFPDLCTVCGDEIRCDDCGKPTTSGCWLEVDDDANAVCEDDDSDFFFDDDRDCLMSGDVSDPMSDDDHGMYVMPYPDKTNGLGSTVPGEREQSQPDKQSSQTEPPLQQQEEHAAP